MGDDYNTNRDFDVNDCEKYVSVIHPMTDISHPIKTENQNQN